MGEKRPIGVVGVGWVGLVTAACFAELGHEVFAMDVDEAKIEALRGGEVPIHEPGLAELVERNRERLRFTTSMDEALAGATLLFCCVDTPPTYSGDADLSRVEAVVAALPEGGEHALVMKSTVPAGTGAAIRRRKPGRAYVSCPEFLKEGSAVRDFMHPDRVVIGADAGAEAAADAVAELYAPLGGELVRTDVASAEMVKLASNAFLATKISFINEIANVCERVDADVTEVARGMGLDDRIGPKFLQAGIGYGGSCFAGDETLLVRGHGWLRFDELWALAGGSDEERVIEPEGLQVWSWVPGEPQAEWMRVAALTRREYDGEMIEVQTVDGARVRATADHPFVVGEGPDAGVLSLHAGGELDPGVLVPVVARSEPGSDVRARHVLEPRPAERTVAAATALLECPPEVGEGQVRWNAVETVRRFRGTAPVYSVEVPGSHTVIVNGRFVVHNCFPKDVSALKMLAGNTGYHFQLLTSVIEVNELQKRRVIAKLEKHLGSLAGRTVALLGLAFKPETDDMREASSLVLASRLQGEGARVVAYDPVAEAPAAELLPSVEMRESVAAALEGADAAVLVTEWPEFAELDWAALRERMATPLVVDGRNFLDPEALRAAGFTYEGIGRSSHGGES